MKKLLFLFTIGPVQSFISQARKTQDLYAGSKLLSDLIGKATAYFPKQGIVFPHPDIESKPNRFIAIIDEGEISKIAEKFNNKADIKTINDIGANLEFNVKKELCKIAEDACKGKTKPSNFESQIKDFLQVYWVALELEDEKDYAEKYREIESLLGAVKNVRTFNQLNEDRRKCSLCGERNALFYKPIIKKDGSKRKPAYIQENAVEIEGSDFRFEQGEGLCALCFTKRCYPAKSPYPSTAKVALMETLNRLNKLELSMEDQAMLNDYRNIVTTFDEQLYYEENLTDNYFRKHYIKGLLDMTKIREKQKRISDITKSNRLELSKYYAIIAFDGDSMGKWLSGSKLKQESDLMKFHNKLSKNLGDFAREAKGYLDNNQRGRTVYAGGDDFLGFVNLNHLFVVMKDLREKFDNRVNDNNLKGYFADEDDKITFSAGIAIAHYKTPLSEVLSWARRMEKEAKDFDDKKDAFGIAVLKHSGEIHKTVYKWQYDGDWPIDLIKEISERLKNDELSNTFIKNLQIEFLKLMDEKERLYEDKFDYGRMLSVEIKRLLERSQKPPKKEITKLAEHLKKLYSVEKKKDNSFENFLSLLNIADFISKHINKGDVR